MQTIQIITQNNIKIIKVFAIRIPRFALHYLSTLNLKTLYGIQQEHNYAVFMHNSAH